MASAVAPAWKRLGLKLKVAGQGTPDGKRLNGFSNGDAIAREIRASQTHFETETDSRQPLKKRKTEKNQPILTLSEVDNRVSERKTSLATNGEEPKRRTPKKQVSFSFDTKVNGDSPKSSPTTQVRPLETNGLKKPKNKSKSKSKSKLAKHRLSEQKSIPALDYLTRYHNSRSTWKFNKNLEIWILKHILSVADIPREFEIPLARYIHGLQGSNARQRLKSDCQKQLEEEIESASGQASRAENSKKNEEHQQRFLRDLENPSNLEGIDKHGEYLQWIQQQSRAEILLWALDGSSLSAMTTNLGGASAFKTKEKKRKNRTAIVEYESSSSSSSSGTSGSESDSDSTTTTTTTTSDATPSNEESSES